jgi:hypothetical protein
MIGPTGYWFIDGLDVWAQFAIGIREGTADLLEYGARKPSLTHDWPDQDGIDIDVTAHYIKERTINLRCWLITETEDEFWRKHDALLALLRKPGMRRFTVTAHRGRSYSLVYQSVSQYKQVAPLRGMPDNTIVHEFILTFLEPQPQVEEAEIFLQDDDGAFIIL